MTYSILTISIFCGLLTIFIFYHSSLALRIISDMCQLHRLYLHDFLHI